MKGYMTVRKPRGRRRHAVSIGADDDHDGGAPCGKTGPWVVIPDAEPDCPACKRRAVVG